VSGVGVGGGVSWVGSGRGVSVRQSDASVGDSRQSEQCHVSVEESEESAMSYESEEKSDYRESGVVKGVKQLRQLQYRRI
jgi:hypothetical protein